MRQLDELIRLLAGHFTGPDAPLNISGLGIKKGGKYQLRERAVRFFEVREQLGIIGLPSPEKAEAALRQKLGLPSSN